MMYKDWSIQTYEQAYWPPYTDKHGNVAEFLKWRATCKLESANAVRMFNTEGRTSEEAIERAKQRIDNDNRRKL